MSSNDKTGKCYENEFKSLKYVPMECATVDEQKKRISRLD